MTISNKIFANTIFTIVLLGSAGVSGLAAKQLVTSYPEVKTIFTNDSAKVSEVLAVNSDLKIDTKNQKDNTSSCIITVSGKKYDVLSLKTSHSGGDIFKCDTDMTASFQSQHGAMYSLISKYLVTGSNTVNQSQTLNNSKTSSTKITPSTLATHNTSKSCWIAYSGKVYNVTNNPSWTSCDHHGAKGGKDITSIFPHSNSYISSLPLVGVLSGGTTVTNNNLNSDNLENESEKEDEHENENEQEDEDEWEFEFED